MTSCKKNTTTINYRNFLPFILILITLFATINSGFDAGTNETKTMAGTRSFIVASTETSYMQHPKIQILNNSMLDSFSNKTGRGIPSDPYIIENLEIHIARGPGVEIRNTNRSLVIRNCFIHGAGQYDAGMEIRHCININITSNIIRDNYDGIWMNDGSNIVISQNNISHNRGSGLNIYALKDSIISENIASYNYYGMKVSGHFLIISRNNVTNNNKVGIYLRGGGYCQVIQNYIFENYEGLKVGVDNNIIKQNHVIGSGYYGIRLRFSDMNVISENTIKSDTGYSFCLRWSDYNHIFNNTIFCENLFDDCQGTGNEFYDNNVSFLPGLKTTANMIQNVTDILAGDYIQFTFTGREGDGPVTFQWEFGDGSANSTARNPCHQYTSAGSYHAVLTVIDCAGDSDTAWSSLIIVVEDSQPLAGFYVNATRIELGGWIKICFTGDEGDGPATFQWKFGDGSANSTSSEPVHQYLLPGNYTVILTVFDSDGDSDTFQWIDCITVFQDTIDDAGSAGDQDDQGENNNGDEITGPFERRDVLTMQAGSVIIFLLLVIPGVVLSFALKVVKKTRGVRKTQDVDLSFYNSRALLIQRLSMYNNE
ncbi:MAG: PKD domain-containing protein [Candidatus Hodarchaeota archaeon]